MLGYYSKKIQVFVFLVIHSFANQSLMAQNTQTKINQDPIGLLIDARLGNCITCHSIPNLPEPHGNFGPSLKGIGTKYSFDEIKQWITDARQIHPETLMPPFGSTNLYNPISAEPILTQEQINLIAQALAKLK